MIYYLRFASEAQAKSVLAPFVRDGQWVKAGASHSLDIIGPIIVSEAVVDENGIAIVPDEWDMRFHVNFQGEIGVDVSQFIVHPQTPRRVWA